MSGTLRKTWASKEWDPRVLVEGSGRRMSVTTREKRCGWGGSCYACNSGVFRRNENKRRRRMDRAAVKEQLT